MDALRNQSLIAWFVEFIEGENFLLLLDSKPKGCHRHQPHQCQTILCNTEPELLLNGPLQKTFFPGVCGVPVDPVATEFALLAEEGVGGLSLIIVRLPPSQSSQLEEVSSHY